MESSASILEPHQQAGVPTAWRRRVRIATTGLTFGVFLGLSTPISPMFRLSLPQNKNLMRLVTHSTLASGSAAAIAYAALVDPSATHRNKPILGWWWRSVTLATGGNGSEDPQGKQTLSSSTLTTSSWLPLLNPANAFIPGFASYVACHALYPGLFILQWEPTWRSRVTEYVRLSIKVTMAYSTSHVPFVAAGSIAIGSAFLGLRCIRLPDRVRAASRTT